LKIEEVLLGRGAYSSRSFFRRFILGVRSKFSFGGCKLGLRTSGGNFVGLWLGACVRHYDYYKLGKWILLFETCLERSAMAVRYKSVIFSWPVQVNELLMVPHLFIVEVLVVD
jgi:hypothetical protein